MLPDVADMHQDFLLLDKMF